MATRRKVLSGFSTGGSGASKGPSVPKGNLGSSGNAGVALLLGSMLGQQQRSNISQTLSDVKTQFPGGLPPKSSANIGKDVSLNIPLSQDLTLDEARATSNADAFDAHAKFLEDAMNNWPRQKFVQKFQKATTKIGAQSPGNFFGIPTTVGDSEAQLLNFALKDMSDRLLRLRSGAQINTQELNRLMGLLPSFENITDPTDTNYRVIRTKLYSFRNELSSIKRKILNGQQFDESTKAKIEFDPHVWEDLDGGPGSEVNHPIYSAYLKQKGAQGAGPETQSDPNDPLGVFS